MIPNKIVQDRLGFWIPRWYWIPGARSIQPKFQPVRPGKLVHLKRWTRFFSGWTEPIHWVLNRNFRKVWLNGSRPILCANSQKLWTEGRVFSVFTVTPWKIKMQTIQYRKSRIWEMKEDKYSKSHAKNQVNAIVRVRDIRKNVLPRFIKLCMETPCWCHQYCRRKPTETSVFEFSYQWANSSLGELTKIKLIFILRQGMFR